MPTIVTCPKCNSGLRIQRIPDSGFVRCPSCKVQIRLVEDPQDDLEEVEYAPRPRRTRRRSSRSSSDKETLVFVIRAILGCASVIALLFAGRVIWFKLKAIKDDQAVVALDNIRDKETREQFKRDVDELNSKRKTQQAKWTNYNFRLANIKQEFPSPKIDHRARSKKNAEGEDASNFDFNEVDYFASVEKRFDKIVTEKLELKRPLEELLELMIKEAVEDKKQVNIEQRRTSTTADRFTCYFEASYIGTRRPERVWEQIIIFRNTGIIYRQSVIANSGHPKADEISSFFSKVEFGRGVESMK